MKAKIIWPCCQRCGYQFDPKKDKPVFHFVAEDGDYIGCRDCITELGKICENGTEEEKKAFLEEFKFKPENAEEI